MSGLARSRLHLALIRGAPIVSPRGSEFPPDGTGVSSRWNWSFSRMKLEFHLSGTILERGWCNENGYGGGCFHSRVKGAL